MVVDLAAKWCDHICPGRQCPRQSPSKHLRRQHQICVCVRQTRQIPTQTHSGTPALLKLLDWLRLETTAHLNGDRKLENGHEFVVDVKIGPILW